MKEKKRRKKNYTFYQNVIVGRSFALLPKREMHNLFISNNTGRKINIIIIIVIFGI